MAHIYTSESVVKNGDQVTVTGTVDGIPVTVNFWASAVTGMSQQDQVNFVAALMLSAAYPAQPTDLSSEYPSTVEM